MSLFLILANLKPLDNGPIYAETHMGRFPVEPWNTLSDLAFLVVMLLSLEKTKFDFKRHSVSLASMPILFIGWLGGTLYHALRNNDLWRILDAAPIAAIALLVSVFLWYVLLGTVFRAAAVIVAPSMIYSACDRFNLGPQQMMIGIGYGFLASLIIVPAVLHCRKSHWRGAGLLISAIVSFGIAITFRQLDDRLSQSLLPMGSHWLWHVFGSITALFALKYLHMAELEYSITHSKTN